MGEGKAMVWGMEYLNMTKQNIENKQTTFLDR
jgi:hypothetical protein